MSSTEQIKYAENWDNIDEQLSAFEKLDDDISEGGKITQIYDDYSKSLTKQCIMLKAIESLREKSDRLNQQIDAYSEKIQTEKKLDKLKLQREELEKKFEINKKASNEIERISDFLGFQFELKEDNVYSIQFTNLPVKNPEMTFRFDILENDNKLKVLNCEPAECIDMDEIEALVDPKDEAKFYKLILFTRKKLIDKYRN